MSTICCQITASKIQTRSTEFPLLLTENTCQTIHVLMHGTISSRHAFAGHVDPHEENSIPIMDGLGVFHWKEGLDCLDTWRFVAC